VLAGEAGDDTLDSGRNTHCNSAGRNVLQNHGISADFCPVTDANAAKNLGSRPDLDVVANDGDGFAFLSATAHVTNRHLLKDRAVRSNDDIPAPILPLIGISAPAITLQKR